MKKSILKNKLADFIFNLIEDKIKIQVIEILMLMKDLKSRTENNDSPVVSLPQEFYPRFTEESNVIDLNQHRTSMKLKKFIKDVFNITDLPPNPPKSAA